MNCSLKFVSGAVAIATAVAAPGFAQGADPLLPPNAKPGGCYARVWVPPTYATETVSMLKRDAYERIEIIPAKYGWETDQVMVKEASRRLEVVPATFGWEEERVLVKEASSVLEEVPARYEVKTERVMDRPAHTIWKEGTGPIEKIDNATGEIMCLVEIPATYKTVTKRVLVEPATTREVVIPAEHKTIRRRVMKTPPTTREIEIPAAYETVRVRKLVKSPEVLKTPVPAEYQTVVKTNMSKDGAMAWRSVLCQTNMTGLTVTSIQRALARAGHNPGPIDGVIGRETMVALKAFQREKGLPSGQVTHETIEALGVKVGSM